MNEIKGVKYQMNEYSMIPNKCSPLLESPRLFVAKVCESAMSLPDLVSHVMLILVCLRSGAYLMR